ncbi:hypothetical protein LSAT2_000011, partial [Lamellibrachia satsuma]
MPERSGRWLDVFGGQSSIERFPDVRQLFPLCYREERF